MARSAAALVAAAVGAAASPSSHNQGKYVSSGFPPPPTGSCAKCDGDYSCDEWIAYDPSKYSCPELEKDYACDCSGCTCSGSGPTPPVPPGPSPGAGVTLTLFDKTQYPDAVCLDGTSSGYYVRKGAEASKFLLFFEGGGWCYDTNCDATRQGTISNCQDRAKTYRGSSSTWSPGSITSQFTGMLASSASDNPVYHNWTLVYLPYCDGASFTGDAVVGSLHFKGTAVLNAVIAELTPLVASAQQVVISGGSAGASTVYFHADKMAAGFGLPSGVVSAMPDAGFFLDLKDKDGVDCWPNQMRSLMDVSNGYQGLHAGCLARFPSEQWKCLFPQYYSDLLTTRWFNIQSLYDTSELWDTLRLDCEPSPSASSGRRAARARAAAANATGYPACTGSELALFQSLRQQHIDAWSPLAKRDGNGIWTPACIIHTMTWGHWTDTEWEVPSGSGNTMAAAVQKWLANDNSDGKGFMYIDQVAWPSNKPCAHYD